MNGQFETQNPVENTVTPANQMETPTPEAPKRKETKPPLLRAWQQQWLSRAALAYLQLVKTGAFLSPSKRYCLQVQRL